MDLEEIIADDANKSDKEVKSRASAEISKEDKRAKKIDNDIKESDKNQRKVYAAYIFIIMAVWLIFVLVIFVLIGACVLVYSENVIITFLTTTTIEVIGVFGIVARYLFPTKAQS